MSTQTTQPEKREPMQVRILPSLRIKIDRRRIETRMSLSDWVERAILEALRKKA